MPKKIFIFLIFLLFALFLSDFAEAQCSTLNYPSNTWQRVWYTYPGGSCLGDGPNESTIQFSNSWGYGTVAWGLSNNIQFRSSRKIFFCTPGSYKFTLNHDDGVRLYIDGTLRIDDWNDGSRSETTLPINLSSGWRNFQINWYENTGGAGVHFSYVRWYTPTCVYGGATCLNNCVSALNQNCCCYNRYATICSGSPSVTCDGYNSTDCTRPPPSCGCVDANTSYSNNPTCGPSGWSNVYSTQSCGTDGCVGNDYYDYYCSGGTCGVTITYNASQCSPPLAPTVSCVTDAGNPTSQINVSWTNVANESGYYIYRCSGSGCTPVSQVHSVGANVTSWANSGLSANTTYGYRAIAWNAIGNSPYSNTVYCTTQAAPSPPSAPPSTVSCSTVSSSRIDVSWTSVSGATYYEVYSCQGTTCTPATYLGQTTSLSYSHTGLPPSTSYRYRIKACNSIGCSGYSGATNFCTTQAAPIPSPPSTVNCSTVHASRIDVSWSSVDGATYYEVYSCQGTTCTPSTYLGQTSGTSYSHIGLSEGTTYSYRVRACDTGGCSNYTGIVSCATHTTPADPCTSPSTTRWGAGGPGCSGYNQRCYEGHCYTCSSATGGFFYSDGCSPAGSCSGNTADTQGRVCWRAGGLNQTCDTACSRECIQSQWDDSTATCQVCMALWDTEYECLGPFPATRAPFRTLGGNCYTRSLVHLQDCGARSLTSRRVCVCQY